METVDVSTRYEPPDGDEIASERCRHPAGGLMMKMPNAPVRPEFAHQR